MTTTLNAMKIKCVAPLAGGKRTLAPRIVAELGPHDAYYETPCGGCSILPQKPRCGSEFIGDANPKVVNVLTCLRDFPQTIQAALDDTPFARESWECANAELDWEGIGARVAAAQLAAWWMGPGGLAGTTRKGWFAQRHTKTGGCPAKRWESFKASIPSLSGRLHGVEIRREDFRQSLVRVPDRDGVVAYSDPPYLSKSFQYECDFTPADHAVLATMANQFDRARVVVSYRISSDAEREFLDKHYPPSKWRRVEVEMSKNLASASGTAKRNTEVLLINDARA